MKIAQTLANILENDVVSVALKRTESIDNVIEKVHLQWQVDLNKRNPLPVYRETEGGNKVYRGTDFDLFTLLNSLADRRAVINIPKYGGIAPKTIHENQRIVSTEDRHGEILDVIASKETHSFSVRIKDYQIIEINPDGSETVGAPRNFAVVDYNGKTNPGWTNFEFNPNSEEKTFFTEKKLCMNELPVLENFVHPNLAFAFYGSRYLAAKALSQRIEDEAKHYRWVAKELRSQGINLGGQYYPSAKSFKDKIYTEKVVVENLEAKLVLPKFKGKYPIVGLTNEGDKREYDKLPMDKSKQEDILRYSEQHAKKLSYKICPKITSGVRAVELAYFLNGFQKGKREYGNEKNPGWDIPEWQRDLRLVPRGAKWNVLDFGDAKLAYRIKEKTVSYGCDNNLENFF